MFNLLNSMAIQLADRKEKQMIHVDVVHNEDCLLLNSYL